MNEPLGMSLLEAMATEKAVASGWVDGTPEIITDGETGLLSDANDVVELMANLSLLVHQPELRRRLGVAGRG